MEAMNQLVKQQEVVGHQITALHSNSRKDSSSRKTETYIKNKMELLEQYWQECKNNHSAILNLKIQEHNYFTINYFEQIRKSYEEARNYLEEVEKKLRPSPAEEKESRTMKIQEVRLQQLQHTMRQIETEMSQEISKTKYEMLKQKLTNIWKGICELNEEICAFEPNQKHPYFINKIYLVNERQYEYTMEMLENKNQEISTYAKSTTTRTNIILPKVKIPIFEGEYDTWTTFHDIFYKIIHINTELSTIEKMQYLKTHTRSEAGRIIQHLQISEANYEAAWNLLKNRYHNKRLLLSKLLDKIVEFPIIKYESAEKLKQLYETTNECLEAITNLEIETKSWGPLVSHLIIQKWDKETRKLYEQSLKNPNEVQEFIDIMEFLKNRFQSLESIKMINQNDQNTNYQNIIKYQKTEKVCKYCKLDHNIYMCQKFKALSTEQKIQTVKELELCNNCLKHNSSVKCNNSARCNICQGMHHTYLHRDQRNYNKTNTRSAGAKGSPHITFKREHQGAKFDANTTSKNELQNVFLATALINIKTATGETKIVRVLIDQGSQASFITEKTAQLLGLPRQKIQAEITGVGAGEPKISKSQIVTKLTPRFPSEFTLTTNLIILNKLTQTMPSQMIDVDIKEWKNYMLADPTFNTPGPIDVILGAEYYTEIFKEGLIKAENGLLGQNTEFGWILTGTLQKTKNQKIEVINMISRIEEDQQLTKFWEIETIPQQKIMSEDEKKCEEIFEKTVQRSKDGSYSVRIPFKESSTELGASKPRAVARLLQLEKKFTKNKKLQEEYSTFMQEYLDLNHMIEVPEEEENVGLYYIPHQAVIRESSTTTKLRVVFDASSKTNSGFSLNSLMYTGPRLQNELADILLRWRIHKIVFSVDIEKMYRQIKMNPIDQDYQRIVWRFGNQQPIKEYKLTTTTYGTASAPYLAVKTLQQLANDEKENFPSASETLKNDFYVDDVLTGANSVKEAIALQTELINLLKTGGFNLRKFSSNEEDVLNTLPEDLKEQKPYEISEDKIRKSLGVFWAPQEDIFKFKVELSPCKKTTKRFILSEIAKLFDPLGCLAPIVIKTKILIQDLWLKEMEWDQSVPKEIENRWTKIRDELKSVEEISYPRWINYEKESVIELHGFCDASERAYGASIYSRVIKSNDQIITTLLTAKSKVAPSRIKTTLPRLELCAAVLLSKLLKRTKMALKITPTKTYGWTDSMITLGWIKGDPTRWKTFVANRVSEIQTNDASINWNYVNTTDNPADIISRGMDPVKLKHNTLWWNGPTWLIKNSNDWPQQPNKIQEAAEEVKKVQCHQAKIKCEENELITRYSNFTKLVRITAQCRRFINNCKKHTKQTGMLSVEELKESTEQLIKLTQHQEYNEELKELQKRKKVQKTSSIGNLDPILDEKGLIRVGGRLEKSLLSYSKRHSLILAPKNHLTKLIIQDAHAQTLHGGIQLTLGYVRRKFWIPNGRRTVGSIINQCIKCIRYKSQTQEQKMGNLPNTRVTPDFPFANSGVDYAGPIQIKASKGRGNKSYKGYIAIFICLSTKAIHIEVVSDLSTDSFLAAFRRFVARRGPCHNMYSDNGTNFVGASKILKKEIKLTIENSQTQNKLTSCGTQWHFIPPAAPHFGGLWEAGVKSINIILNV